MQVFFDLLIAKQRILYIVASTMKSWLISKCSCHSLFFVFLSLLATRLQKYCVSFVYNLQGKMGKTERKGKKIKELKWPKYQKPKWQKYGMNEIQDSNSISAKYLGFNCIPCTHSFASKFKKCLMAIVIVWYEKSLDVT